MGGLCVPGGAKPNQMCLGAQYAWNSSHVVIRAHSCPLGTEDQSRPVPLMKHFIEGAAYWIIVFSIMAQA